LRTFRDRQGGFGELFLSPDGPWFR
jgi:hypothetical protein